MDLKLINEFGMEKDAAEKLIQAVADRAVSLLLGAGASYGCTGGDKIELKGAPDLANAINKNFHLELTEPDASNLLLVYGDAAQPKLKTRLNNFLYNKYTNCTPTWQRILFNFPWKRMWTLNIDDVIQRAGFSSKNVLREFNWTEEFKPRNIGNNELQLIHLHGKALDLMKSPDHLIFSIKEYANRIEQSPGWHTEFNSEFAQKPFIVCGARLQEEFDLISVIEYGNRSWERGGSPSLIVLPSFAPGQEARFKRQGLIPIAATGEHFFKMLNADLIAYKEHHPEINPEYQDARTEIISKFRKLIDDKNLNDGGFNKKILDFYGAAESQWAHIQRDFDAQLPHIINAARWLTENDTATSKLLLFHGGTTSGKTAAALRVAMTSLSVGYEVQLFRAEEIFDSKALINYLRIRKNVVLIFDDCADYSSSIRILTEESIRQNVQLRLVSSTDTNRLRAVQPDFYESYTREVKLDPLSHDSFIKIFEKRLSKGRLGRCTNMDQADAWSEFRSAYNFRLLEWLESLENARPFHDAILKIFEKNTMHPSPARNLICATAAVQRFGLSLPLFLTNRLRRNLDLDLLLDEEGELNSLAYLDESGLRLRSRAFSIFVWGKMSKSDKYLWSQTIVKWLAPLIVPYSISRRRSPYTIARHMMDWEEIRRDFGVNADGWYGDLEALFGWNARFWEQRALLANANDNFTIAYSFAKKAISRHSTDAFPWTTLGKICVRLGIERHDGIGLERFWEGVTALDHSRKLAQENGVEWEHPYTTFFSYALKAIHLDHFLSDRQKLIQDWNEWMRLARRSHAFVRNQATLDNFQRNWLLIAVPR